MLVFLDMSSDSSGMDTRKFCPKNCRKIPGPSGIPPRLIVTFFSLNNVFIIGKGNNALVSLPADKGIKLSIAEERDRRLAAKKV